MVLHASQTPTDHLVGLGLSSEVFRYGPDHVLKLYRSPCDPAAVANEFRAARQAHAYGLPVPEAVAIVERDGRTGIVFEAVQGRNLLGTHKHRPHALLAALAHLAQVHCAINARVGSDLPGQHETLRGQIGRARVSEAVKRAALRALQGLPDGDRLCHGDLHPENVICSPLGLRVVDWQKATRGNPAGDVARTALLLRHGRLDIGPLGRFLPLDAIRAAIAWFYVAQCCRTAGLKRSEVLAWRLPLLTARLCGQIADSEDAVRAEAERLARAATERVPSRSFLRGRALASPSTRTAPREERSPVPSSAQRGPCG